MKPSERCRHLIQIHMAKPNGIDTLHSEMKREIARRWRWTDVRPFVAHWPHILLARLAALWAARLSYRDRKHDGHMKKPGDRSESRPSGWLGGQSPSLVRRIVDLKS